jgi:phage gp29-like protein
MKLFQRKQKIKETPQIPSWQLSSRSYEAVPTKSYELYEKMQVDSMIQTALTVKKLGVLASDWRLEGEQEIVEFVEENFRRMQGSPFTILRNAMDAFAHGWSIQELVMESRDGKWWINAVRPKNPRFFKIEFDQYEQPLQIRLELPGDEPLFFPIEKFVMYRNRSSYGRPYGASDLDAAIPHYLAKVDLLGAWKLHLDRFASPTLLGKFSRNASNDDQSALLRSLERLNKNTAIVFPEEFDVSTLGDQTVASTGFMDALDFHNREMARAILGQTLTTDEGRRVGSLAMGKVHLQVLLLQLQSIRKELADEVMTEQVIRPLVEMNFQDAEVPRFVFETATLEAFRSGAI